MQQLKTYQTVQSDIAQLLRSGRLAAVRSVNSVMTATYWAVGQRIVEAEQKGRRRAGYGDQLILQLAADLTLEFGRGELVRSSTVPPCALYSIREATAAGNAVTPLCKHPQRSQKTAS